MTSPQRSAPDSTAVDVPAVRLLAASADAVGDRPRQPVDLARRAVIAGALTVAGGAALVACGSSGSSAGTTPSSRSSSASSSPSSSSSSAAAGGAAVIVKLSDVPVGSAVSATLAGKQIVVAQPTKGKVVAYSAICTHMGCTVKPAGAKLDCPCHGSVFDAATGKNLSGPAPSPLPAVPVKLNASGDGVVSA